MIVNAAATLTKLGGSIMPNQVLLAMAAASQEYVDLVAEYELAGQRIAQLTRNEGAAVTSGAAAALTLTAASILTGPEPQSLDIFPLTDRPHILMFGEQRNDYDMSIRILGVDIRNVASNVEDLKAAVATGPLLLLWFAGNQYPVTGISFEEVMRICREAGVPVVVDAAAQIPPRESLWHFTRDLGATAAIFSGGKGLRGPQNTGLMVGSDEVARGIRAHASPHHGIGRGMKVTKEGLAGIEAAITLLLNEDEDEKLSSYEAIVSGWIEALQALGYSVSRGFPSEAGQPHSRALIHCESSADAAALADKLWNGTPRVSVLVHGATVALNPQPLLPGQESLVVRAFKDIQA